MSSTEEKKEGEKDLINIVINRCYGGFCLSDLAIQEYAKRKGCGYSIKQDDCMTPMLVDCNGTGTEFYADTIPRDDPDLVSVVRQLGEQANGSCARLLIIQVPQGVDWIIEENEGIEWVAERHRCWPSYKSRLVNRQ